MKIVNLNAQITENLADKVKLEDNIATLDAKIIDQRNQIVELSNENDDIKMKGGELSPVNFDVLNSQLNIAHAEIKQKDL